MNHAKITRIGLPIAVAISVFYLANWYIENNYDEIANNTRNMIAIGGSILAAIIMYVLYLPDRKQ